MQFRAVKNRGKSRLRGYFVVVTTAVMILFTAPAASATAYDFVFWGGKTVGDVYVPAGVLEHYVKGDGLTVVEQWGDAESISRMCNVRIDFEYNDVTGKRYRTDKGQLYGWCGNHFYREVHPGTLRAGLACVALYVSGAFIVRHCHQIAR